MFWINEVNDYSETYYPIFLEIRRNFWHNFQLPLWREGILGGLPLFGDSFAMFLNPINWLVLFVGPVWFFPLAVFIAFIMGTVGMFKLLKRVNNKRKDQIFLALAYMLLPLSIAHLKAGHLNIYQAVSFYPWIVYFFSHYLKTKRSKDIVLTSIFSLLVLFSHPGMFYVFNLFFIPFLFFLLLNKQIKLKPLFLYGLIVSSLGAVYFLPAMELSQYLTRSLITDSDIVPVWTARSLAGGLIFPYPKLSTIDQEAILYPGIIILLMAIFGVIKSKRRVKIVSLIVIFLSLFLSLGNKTPLYKIILQVLPFAGALRVSSRFWYIALFIIVLFAYKGIIEIKNRKWALLMSFLVLVELITFAGLRLSLPGRYGKISDLAMYQKYFANSADKFRVYATTHALSQRKMVEANSVLADGEYPLQLNSYINYLKKAGGYNFDTYSVIQPPYQIYKTQPQPKSDLLGKLSVLYVVSPYHLRDDGFKKVDEESNLSHRNFKSLKFLEPDLPRPTTLDVGALEERRFTTASVAPGATNLILYKNLKFKDKLWSEEANLDLISYKKGSNVLFAVFETDKETFINWSVNYYPGWEVKVDGRQIKLIKENSWMKFKLPAGKHELEAKFYNKYYLLGRNISLISTIVIILYLANFATKASHYKHYSTT